MQKHERAVTRWQIKMGLDDFFSQQNDSVCAQVPYKGKKKTNTTLSGSHLFTFPLED